MPANAVKTYQSPLPWTVTTSLALHVTIGLALLFQMAAEKTFEPVGIEMLYLGEAKTAVAKVLPHRVNLSQQQVEKNQGPREQAFTDKDSGEPTSIRPVRTGQVGVRDGAVVPAIERYKYELRLFLESRKIYPETARRLRQTGKVVLNFKVSSAGQLTDVRVERASGSEILNRAALDLVEGASRFKPFPPETQSNELQITLPIEYIL